MKSPHLMSLKNLNFRKKPAKVKRNLQWRAPVQISEFGSEIQKLKLHWSFQCRFQVFGSEIQKLKLQWRAPLQIAGSEAEIQKPKLQWRAPLQISASEAEIQKLNLHWGFDFGYISQTYGISPRVPGGWGIKVRNTIPLFWIPYHSGWESEKW